jgi:hypothetical protein
MPNHQGDQRDQNELYVWQTLQKALKKIEEQQKIIDSLAIYIIQNAKDKAGKMVVKQKRPKANSERISKKTRYSF